LEIFVIPGFGIAGVSGIILMIAALILAVIDWVPGDWANAPSLNEFSAAIAFVAVSIFGAIALIIIVAKFLPKAPVTRSIFLSEKMDKEKGYAAFDEEKYKKWLGKIGVAKTDLRPAGKAVIENSLLDVVTQGGFIEKNSRIKVVSVDSNNIVVSTDETDKV
jgi:membrane-bound serine protease (ClpP class)